VLLRLDMYHVMNHHQGLNTQEHAQHLHMVYQNVLITLLVVWDTDWIKTKRFLIIEVNKRRTIYKQKICV